MVHRLAGRKSRARLFECVDTFWVYGRSRRCVSTAGLSCAFVLDSPDSGPCPPAVYRWCPAICFSYLIQHSICLRLSCTGVHVTIKCKHQFHA